LTNPLAVVAFQVKVVSRVHVAINTSLITSDSTAHHYALWCWAEYKQLDVVSWVRYLHRATCTRHLQNNTTVIVNSIRQVDVNLIICHVWANNL